MAPKRNFSDPRVSAIFARYKRDLRTVKAVTCEVERVLGWSTTPQTIWRHLKCYEQNEAQRIRARSDCLTTKASSNSFQMESEAPNAEVEVELVDVDDDTRSSPPKLTSEPNISAKRREECCDAPSSWTASSRSGYQSLADTRQLTVSSVVIPDRNNPNWVRVYRKVAGNKDTEYFSCATCDSIARKSIAQQRSTSFDDSGAVLPEADVMREGQATVKTVHGRVVGNPFPVHHPHCYPISAQHQRAAEINSSHRVSVSSTKGAWCQGNTSSEMEDLEPTLKNVIEQDSLKWIFVGGKGGVGKTTCSCSLAVRLAEVRRSVLIISTDPAHNISDAFSQKFTKTPTLVSGFDNLYAMEVDASVGTDTLAQAASASNVTSDGDMLGMGRQVLQELAGGLPGMDEAMSFSQMIRLIQSMDFDAVIFDTAPTGHTLRLLHFPDIVESSLEKMLSLQSSFSPMFSQVKDMLGLGEVSMDETTSKMRETLDIVKRINTQFKNPEMTTFICVCIAEFLSLYETERLIQELTKQNIDTHNIVVNQLLFPEQDDNECVKCKKCAARYNIQRKYLEQISDLYEDFNVTKLPLLDNEVRGVEHIKRFSEFLVTPYDPSKHPSGF